MRRLLLIGLLPALVGATCGPDGPSGPPDDTGRPDIDDAGTDGTAEKEFSFTIGRTDGDSEFTKLESDDTVDVVRGFQSIKFVRLALLAPETVPTTFSATKQVHFPEASEYDFRDRDRRVRFGATHDGRRLARDFRVPFGQDMSLLEGETVELTIELRKDDWHGTGSTRFQIASETTE